MGLPLDGKEIILGITGGIAAYKSCELVRGLRENGASVSVVMTEAACRFVSPLTFSALSGRDVSVDLFEPRGIPHIDLTARADAFVVAPATANIIGKAANGIADDLLSTMLMAAKCPVLFAPAMNCRMFDSPALQNNLKILKDRGVFFAGPEEGPMACGEFGWGRMSESADILQAVFSLFREKTLSGKKVLVTAGPTYEDLDPVRFIGNRSTGRMGFAVAKEAVARGAEVTLIYGPVALTPPQDVKAIPVRSASEMEKAALSAFRDSDISVMAAAVSDFAPAEYSRSKIKKEGHENYSLKLIKTPDILSAFGKGKKKGQVVIGFAAETERAGPNALKKLKEKNADLVAANIIGKDTGFGSLTNRLYIYDKNGLARDTGLVSKDEAAGQLLDCVAGLPQLKEIQSKGRHTR
ncbi:MAG: bifunctional phosphopantothenoylcysteine decarboxylase/phosphopantothenate--cysteine ligase CoaBC [Nitrospirota bacterium]